MTTKMPASFRLIGPAAEQARGRLPFEVRDDAAAVAVALRAEDADGVASVAAALPEADTLAGGTLVIVLPSAAAPSLAGRFLAALGRGRTISRAHRCSALLARGYVRIGASVDPASGLDLAFGYAPAR